MSFTPGTTLGPYSVTAKIGEGGRGRNYVGREKASHGCYAPYF